MSLQYVFAFIGCIPGIITMSPCQHGARLRRLTAPGYYSTELTVHEDSSTLRCAALCLGDPSCAAISVTSLNSTQSMARAGRRVYCQLSDGTGEFVPDRQWLSYTILSYSPAGGTCDPRFISETTLPATTTEVPTTPRTCPSDFVTLNGGCYKYHQEKKTWTDAKTTCESEADHLVALTSLQEQNQIAIAIYGIRGAGVTFHGGGNDMDSDGVWEWPDGQPFDFSHWEGAVPTGGCLVVRVHPGKWTTGSCTSAMREFMCEIDI